MMKFISGCIVGGAVVGLGFYLLQEPAPSTPPTVPDDFNSAYQSPDPQPFLDDWANVGTSDRLGTARTYPFDAPELAPVLPPDFPVLSLTTERTLGTVTQANIQRVCITPIWEQTWTGTKLADDKSRPVTAFTVNVWLTVEGRDQAQGTTLTEDGAVASFVLNAVNQSPATNQPFVLSRFTVAAEKAAHYREPSAEPDFHFSATQGTAFAGLEFAKRLAGSNSLEPCTAGDDLAVVPGYREHRLLWQSIVEQYPARLKDYQAFKADEQSGTDAN